ncbi:hypothetical protein MPC4_30012 [Methylocella tundrae]|uniref:Uncharacterized protein n=1 Tax=Methylocella tundrae TaxID=227605 RepID=A0A8B6M7U3_METTU|nr:hypothetical protein MPC1_970003 [Methylocella tundrae]VTZ50828.1 hypothetical protein MPC4_30012 [Methylocella tundrae]
MGRRPRSARRHRESGALKLFAPRRGNAPGGFVETYKLAANLTSEGKSLDAQPKGLDATKH